VDLSGGRASGRSHTRFSREKRRLDSCWRLPGCAQQATLALTHNTSAILYRADRTEAKCWAIAPATRDLELEPFGVRLLVAR